MTVTASGSAPADLDQLWREYYAYVCNLVRKRGIPAQEAPDVASEILTRLIERDIIGMYDPDHTVEHRGEKWHASFRTFLSHQVGLYVRGHKERLGRRGEREVLLCDQLVDGSHTWAEMFGGSVTDDYSGLDVAEFVERARAYLQQLPPRSDRDRCDLVALLDAVVEQVTERGSISHTGLQQQFGISSTSSYAWVGRLKEALDAERNGVPPPPPPPAKTVITWTISGVVLTVADVRDAIAILSASKSIMVRQPLARAEHPLSRAEDPNWYHPFSAEERALYPGIEVEAADHHAPAGHVKVAVLHRLERMLAEAQCRKD